MKSELFFNIQFKYMFSLHEKRVKGEKTKGGEGRGERIRESGRRGREEGSGERKRIQVQQKQKHQIKQQRKRIPRVTLAGTPGAISPKLMKAQKQRQVLTQLYLNKYLKKK